MLNTVVVESSVGVLSDAKRP